MADPTAEPAASQVNEDMPYTIDVPLLATIHVHPTANLTDAVDLIRQLAGHGIDVQLGDDVTLHQVSVRGPRRPGMVLISGPCKGSHVRLDGMQEPRVCRTCHDLFDETTGRGSNDGDCGDCADRRDRHPDDDGCGTYDVGHWVNTRDGETRVEDLEPGDEYEDPAYPGDWHTVNEVVVIGGDVHVDSNTDVQEDEE